MNTKLLALLFVLVTDQAVKLLLFRIIGSGALPLGPFGSVRMVNGRLWMLPRACSGLTLWGLWTTTAIALLVASQWLPSSSVFVGLLLGGSLSNALESSWRGSVSDYLCLRFWPAFNLADLALTVGAIGMIMELLQVMRGTGP
jgi:signal peptidase II